MKSQSFILPASADRSDMLGRILRFAHQLGKEKRWRVTFEPYVKKRTTDQNALLWSLYADILDRGGEELAGYTSDDLHEFFLISHFGHETKEIFGRKRLTPLRRSSKLTTTEFSDFIEYIVRFMAEKGVYLELPGDQ